eukprot:588205-Prorocentrum_lima.AAC.1
MNHLSKRLSRAAALDSKLPSSQVPIESVAEFQDFNAADYDPNDVVESGKQYFKDKFLERDDAKSHRMIHTHFTCATDRKSMEKLIEEILSQ